MHKSFEDTVDEYMRRTDRAIAWTAAGLGALLAVVGVVIWRR